ncbi:MAG: serine hydrolase domain-containing protein, partial [Saprospiraceae bacterium]|nr:serine hydrolase domain-containing protein [Saprospiraceae bacterium]
MRVLVVASLALIATLVGCQNNGIEPTGDTYWVTADPAEMGMDPDSLSKAVDLAANMPNFYALLVTRSNRLVSENYFKGRQATQLYHLRSVTKNIVSAAAGMALDQGILDSLNASIQPDYPAIVTGDKAAITLAHLLNMASGLEWDEDTEVIPLIQHQIPDPVLTILGR